MKRRKKTKRTGAASIFAKARRAPSVRSKARMITKLESRLRTLRRKRQAAYKKACKRIARKKRR